MTKPISATFVAIIGISLLTTTVTEASSPAKPNTAYSLEVLPADHTIKKDPVTGATLTFLTTKTPSSGIYFHERSWLADSSMIVFWGHRGLMGYLTETGELVVLAAPSGGLGAATAAAQRNSVFCMRGGDVLELALTIEASPTPAGTPSKVTVVARRIATLPSGGQLNISHDDRYLSIILKKKGVNTINVISVADGLLREVCREASPNQWRGHLQWSRTASNLLSFVGGDDWHREGAASRLWVVDPKKGVPKEVYHQIAGELVTHESWWLDDQILFCGAPPAIRLKGDPAKREFSHVKVLDTKTGVVRIIGAGSWWPGGSDAEIWKRNWWHCAGSEDGRWIVADTFHGDIALFEGTTTRPRLLTTGHRTFGGGTHPHPGWDRRGKQVIFSSNMLSDKVNACVANIPENWQTQNPAPRN